MNFYGFEHTYGIGTLDEDGNRIGTLRVFDSRSERQLWEEHDCDCNEAITASEARCILRQMVKCATGEDTRFMRIEELLKLAYASSCNVW